MTDPWQTAVVAEIRTLTPRIKSFILELPRPAPFIAGQHADVRLTADDGYVAMRSYSIASSPDDSSRIELAIERLDDGEVSPFFHDVVVVGDEIEVRTPLGGHFIWRPTDPGPLLLIGAGSGVVPLMAMVRHRQSTASNVPAVLIASSTTWDALPLRDELLALHRARNGFTLVLTLTRGTTAIADVAVHGHRIDAAVLKASIDSLPASPREVFICGSNGFVDVAADAAIANGVAAAVIRAERYGAATTLRSY